MIFVAKLSDSETEAAETINWLDFSVSCKYISKEEHHLLTETYDHIIGKLANMSRYPQKWTF
ncbi:MAG: four helix bundle protein [Balneolaceae bacterium]|nr:four helix bundle protein [Balneolaceae bacterium]